MFKALKIFVLLLFLQPQVSNTVVWTLYEFNKEYITEAFCINKDKPELKCNGKCHLSTQLTEPVLTNTEQPVAVNYISQIQLFYQELPEFSTTDYSPHRNIYKSFQFYAFKPLFEIDEPPRA